MRALLRSFRRRARAASAVPRRLMALLLAVAIVLPAAAAAGLDELRARGELRHLGVPYANFVTGAGDGMDVELMQGFARWLGVDYRFVETDWSTALGDLLGRTARAKDGGGAELLESVPIKGDVIANGMTVIPWREQVVRFGEATFPTQVWLISRAEAPVSPIRPSANLTEDIVRTKSVLGGRSLLGKLDTCLDPSLYGIERTGAEVQLFGGALNELAPALLNEEADLTLLDVPDALVALEKWPGRIKVIGPVSEPQEMAPAFRPQDADLQQAFDRYLAGIRADGTYLELVRRYYPFVFEYFPEFFADDKG